MTGRLRDHQLFFEKTADCIKVLRDLLRVQNLSYHYLDDPLQVVGSFIQVADSVEVDSFRLIGVRLEKLLLRHANGQTTPSRIELETIELAVDWLEQLSILYEEKLPEPKSLVFELLYTFDLVENSQDAVSLSELVGQGAASRVDPFLEDPGFDVVERPVPSHQDPFAEDPGFGLEFDLLQRTINFVVETRNIDPEDDDNIDTTTTSATSYDLFATDPPLSDESDSIS